MSSVREGSDYVRLSDVMVAMRDGTKLACDVYLPAARGRVIEGARYPTVMIRTPYNKDVVSPELVNPGAFWTSNDYACLVQDVRGRFKSEGRFYKYVNEAEDGYDTCEWVAEQPWSNGSVATDGPSYLTHVQTSMALLRPPHLKAMLCNKGGHWNAYTSCVRQGGTMELRQWVWGAKKASNGEAPSTTPALRRAGESMDAWFARYPWRRGDSPLALAPEYERYLLDQLENDDYSVYWKQVGLNTEEHRHDFADVPSVFLSGYYDIYARSTVEFFTNLSPIKRSHMCLVMGPWQHTGREGHVSGDVDFGISAALRGSLAPDMYTFARRWFDRFVDPAVVPPQSPPSFSDDPAPSDGDVPQSGGALYGALAGGGDDRDEPGSNAPLPPRVVYFRMGGGDGHKTQAGFMMHGGEWRKASTWPPTGARDRCFYMRPRGRLGQRPSDKQREDEEDKKVADAPLPPAPSRQRPSAGLTTSAAGRPGPSEARKRRLLKARQRAERRAEAAAAKAAGRAAPGRQAAGGGAGVSPGTASARVGPAVGGVDAAAAGKAAGAADPGDDNSEADDLSDPADDPDADSSTDADSDADDDGVPLKRPGRTLNRTDLCTTFRYDPANPCPSIGGNVFNHRNVLMAGAFNQVETPRHFLCQPPFGLPLTSRGDVVAFRSRPLDKDVEVTGSPVAVLYVSSDAPDTDFHVKLVDEYPPNDDYPGGYAMNVTHGIQRVSYRLSSESKQFVAPGRVYEVHVELYPTSNLFARGHRIRVDVSSSCFPHFSKNNNRRVQDRTFQVANNTVHHSTRFPSHVILPVVPIRDCLAPSKKSRMAMRSRLIRHPVVAPAGDAGAAPQ